MEAKGGIMNEAKSAARTSHLAVCSLVFGILGIIPFGLIGAIPAVVCGHLALSRIKRSAGALLGNGRAAAGLTLGYVSIVFSLLILPAMLLPAASAARERARRTHCMSNISQLAKGLVMYCMDHDERLPARFEELAETGYVTEPLLFICRSADQDSGALTSISDWTSYAYVSGLQAWAPSKAVNVFCHPVNHGNRGCNVGYMDGSVEWMHMDEFTALTNNPSLFFGTTDEAMIAELQERTKIIWPGGL